MTDQEFREKNPNIATLFDAINKQDRPMQFAALLLTIAAGLMGKEGE